MVRSCAPIQYLLSANLGRSDPSVESIPKVRSMIGIGLGIVPDRSDQVWKIVLNRKWSERIHEQRTYPV
jgi:hypothetical protein